MKKKNDQIQRAYSDVVKKYPWLAPYIKKIRLKRNLNYCGKKVNMTIDADYRGCFLKNPRFTIKIDLDYVSKHPEELRSMVIKGIGRIFFNLYVVRPVLNEKGIFIRSDFVDRYLSDKYANEESKLRSKIATEPSKPIGFTLGTEIADTDCVFSELLSFICNEHTSDKKMDDETKEYIDSLIDGMADDLEDICVSARKKIWIDPPFALCLCGGFIVFALWVWYLISVC